MKKLVNFRLGPEAVEALALEAERTGKSQTAVIEDFLLWRRLRSDPCVVVDAAASKVRRRRIVPVCPVAVSWLALDVSEKGPIVSSHSTLRRARRETSKRAGVPWSQDVLRHTYASMRIARGDPVEKVAHDMGNSPRILLTHYRELVRREDAQAFWELRPKVS